MANEADHGPARVAYEANPREARTDLLIEGMALLKFIAAAALAAGVGAPMANRPGWQVIPVAAAVAVAALLAFDWAAHLLARRRGRARRDFPEVAGDTFALVRRTWFLPLLTVFDSLGAPAPVGLLGTCLAVAGVELVGGLVGRSRGAAPASAGRGVAGAARQPMEQGRLGLGRDQRGTRRTRDMPQFAATIKHLKDGVKGFTVAAAVKNIEGWETTLEKVEVTGVKTLHADLAKLKKLLQADEIDGAKVKDLMLKLGKETVTIAGRSDSKNAEKIKELGEAVTHAAEHAAKD